MALSEYVHTMRLREGGVLAGSARERVDAAEAAFRAVVVAQRGTDG